MLHPRSSRWSPPRSLVITTAAQRSHLQSTSRARRYAVSMIRPTATIVYATASGGTTLDQDSFGGNPFATALIELSIEKGLRLDELLTKLRQLTVEKSFQHQTPAWDQLPPIQTWDFALEEGSQAERRIALVLVVSQYDGLAETRLQGAAHDERRISVMLAANGFSVIQGVAPDRGSLRTALRSFSVRSKDFDVALIYSTGHGVECNGQPFLLAGSYPFELGFNSAALHEHAISVNQIASTCKATTLNLTFFAGCRSHT